MTKLKEGLDVLPLVGNLIKYKDECLDFCDKYEVIAIDLDYDAIVVKHTYQSFGEQVSYFGILFSEYFRDMEVVND